MQVSRATAIWIEYHRSYSRDDTLKAYQSVLDIFTPEFGNRQISEISTEDMLSFLNRITEGRKPQTRRLRYAHLSAFFNFIRDNLDLDFGPRDTPTMKMLFSSAAQGRSCSSPQTRADRSIHSRTFPC